MDWFVFNDTAGIDAPPHGPWTVTPRLVFVLGDNRENSYDSRMRSGLTLGAIIRAVLDSPALPKGAEALQPELDSLHARVLEVSRARQARLLRNHRVDHGYGRTTAGPYASTTRND